MTPPRTTESDFALAADFGAINGANPFLPERVEIEERILGVDYIDQGAARARRAGVQGNPNTEALRERAEGLLERLRGTLFAPGGSPSSPQLDLYEGVVLFTLYHRYRKELGVLVDLACEPDRGRLRVPFAGRFLEEAARYLSPEGHELPLGVTPVHLLGVYFQIARAFEHTYAHILGNSRAAVNLRAAIWQSVFSHDLRRYQRVLYRHMRELSTLVTGPSGTGKELVARAVGLSSYLPFDEATGSFQVEAPRAFLPLNLSALSPTLIESELFGHRRGAFTGALGERAGWFEVCLPHGSVFLDEIGDIAPDIQLKLLRVLQTRTFQRLGDTETRTFQGKLISATNRDLSAEMSAGRFREDLYYRLCSDRIVTPSLAELIDGSLDELRNLVLHVSTGLVDEEAPALSDEVLEHVEGTLGADYSWPGNFRELEQCVRGILLRKEYRPREEDAAGSRERLAKTFLATEASAEEILRSYCTLAYARLGSFEGAARVLGLDRRTVKAKIDPELLEEL